MLRGRSYGEKYSSQRVALPTLLAPKPQTLENHGSFGHVCHPNLTQVSGGLEALGSWVLGP